MTPEEDAQVYTVHTWEGDPAASTGEINVDIRCGYRHLTLHAKPGKVWETIWRDAPLGSIVAAWLRGERL